MLPHLEYFEHAFLMHHAISLIARKPKGRQILQRLRRTETPDWLTFVLYNNDKLNVCACVFFSRRMINVNLFYMKKV